MQVWSQAPLARLLLPLVAGIITAVYSGWRSPSVFFALAAAFAVLLLLQYFISFKIQWLHGLLVATAMFFTGFGITLLKTEKYNASHFSNYLSDESLICVKLSSAPLEKERSIRFVAEVLAVADSNEQWQTRGHAMLYFPKDSAALSLRYGDVLFVAAAFNTIPAPQNPSEFDYRRYLSFHNIWQQAYVDSARWSVQAHEQGNAVIGWSIGLRDRLLDVMRRNRIGGDEFAVGAALLLGYEDKLDQDIINSYSATGALHVLSVSGLHVGIIYLVFNSMLMFLERGKGGRLIKAAVLILLLWFYASLTGLSPSVLRSATMFGFIILGKAMNRHTNIYNVLSASALLLLLIDPYLIMQVGFQLSYLAVAGIVYLQPKIYGMWQPKSWLLDKVWAITAVSIAAQVATFPLGLHYFHQFPNYFLFSNLLVIPLSTLVIYIGIALFIFSGIDLIASWLAALFEWMLWLLNHSVKVFEYLPFAVLQGITITVAETWIIYAIMALLLFFIAKRDLYYVRAGLMLLVAFLVLQFVEGISEREQRTFIVYNVPKRSSYDLICGKENVLLADTALLNNSSRMLFHIKHNWWDRGLDDPKEESLFPGKSFSNDWMCREGNVLQFCDQRIALVSESFRGLQQSKLKVDKLILSKDAKVKIKDVLDRYDVDLLIFDASNSKRSIRRWSRQCKKLNIKFYSVPSEGAYIEEM
jgi:competence protein ComEC